MARLVPGTVVRCAVVVLSIVAIPTLARSRVASDPAAPAQTVEAAQPQRSISEEPAATEPAVPSLPPVEPVAPVPLEPPEHATPLDELVAAGQYWRLETPRGPVHVWKPLGYDPRTAATIVFVHGYNTDADTMWDGARLPQQFALSGVNALFIEPEAPYGKYATMMWPSLNALLRAVSDGIAEPMPKGKLVAVGHSGAYRTLVLWLQNTSLSTVVLLDAAYAEFDRFASWARGAQHRFIDIAYETQPFCEFMHRSIPGTKKYDGLPSNGFPDDVRTSRVLYVRTDIGHWPLVTGGLALPLALRTLDAPRVPDAPLDLPLGFEPDARDVR